MMKILFYKIAFEKLQATGLGFAGAMVCIAIYEWHFNAVDLASILVGVVLFETGLIGEMYICGEIAGRRLKEERDEARAQVEEFVKTRV